MSRATLTVALAGNPNSGKSTLFNAITGSRQHVGNYPGVTVEKTEGIATHKGIDINLVDLPGTYSLTAYSLEEVVTRNFILDDSPDVVVDVIDSANLERNLYLATQLIELGVPLVLAFNMSDISRMRGYDINIRLLSKLLGVPIVRTTANRKRGIQQLLNVVLATADQGAEAVKSQRQPKYGHEVGPHVAAIAEKVTQACHTDQHSRWFAVKLLEGDEQTTKRVKAMCGNGAEDLLVEAEALRKHIAGVCGDNPEIILADRRYGFISGACTEAVRQTVESRHERSDKIDAVLTNRYLALPIFAVLMYLVFQLTFAIGNPIVGYLDAGKGALAEWVRSLGPESMLVSLLADGVIEGVGAVLVFVPLIVLLYVGVSILEDTGYMARAAFVLDNLMHRMGLHGKSFIPMLIGFGCTVPAVMSTRILESRRDRLTTVLVLPLMSCGARLPIYVLIIGAFFPARNIHVLGILNVSTQGLMLFGIYAVGIVLAVICSSILRKTILHGETSSFVMELPPYRLPAMRGVLVHVWERSREYVKKAGTIILAIVIVLWALKTWPAMPDSQRRQYDAMRESIRADANLSSLEIDDRIRLINLDQQRVEMLNSTIGMIGRGVAPVLRPCGFDWRISTALLGSLAAKEVFIGQMGLIYSVADEGSNTGETLRSKLSGDYTPLQGICIMLFILISSPCVATVAVTIKESGSWKWGLLQWGYLTVLAWIVTTAVYQAGSLLSA